MNQIPTADTTTGASPANYPPRHPRRRIITLAVFAGLALVLVTGSIAFALGQALAGRSTGNSAAAPAAQLASTTGIPDATQNYGAQPAKYTVENGVKVFHFTAERVMWEVARGLPRVEAWTLDGTVPGPTIRVTAGDHVRILITNHLPEPTAIHWHGLDIPYTQDGVPGLGQQPIAVGATYTYDFTIPVDNFGTYFYHSHYDALKQESMGLYGAFIVDPKPGTVYAAQQPRYDREYLQMVSELGGYFVINGKSFPDTQPMVVTHGQNILIRLINIGELIHPMHLHGHVFSIVAEDGQPLAQPIRKNTISIAPGEDYDLLFHAWAAPGSIYPFHCHILAHTMGNGPYGMGGLITLVEYTK